MPTLPNSEEELADPATVSAAASWFARLNADTVSIQDLSAFQAWRRRRTNDRAYREVEAMWGRGGALRADPEIARVLAAALAPARPGRRSMTVGIGFAAAATVTLAVIAGVVTELDGLLSTRAYQTGVGRQQQVALADGSALRLDADSRVAVRFGFAERHLELLRGRAYFSVAHDTRRPFVVVAGDVHVRAVGTRFSVRRDPGKVQVVLVQGVVTVSGRATGEMLKPSWTMKAGQELTSDGAASRLASIDIPLATGWLQSRLIFHGLPLRDAIAEVNRYNAEKVVLEAPRSVDTPLSGVFNAADPAAFAAAAADVCGLDVRTRADGALVLHSKGAAPT